MKKQFIIAAILLLSGAAFAQTNLVARYRLCNQCANGLDATTSNQTFTYGNSSEYPTNLIADDYGPRQNGTDTYDWHGGIDYNSGSGNADMGDLILALMGGTITGTLGSGYKRLIVQAGGQNFGYGHLFTTGGDNSTLPNRSGGCWLSVMNDNFSRCIVIVADGDTTAISTVGGGTVSFDGKIFSVSNTITAGAPIGPTGYSGLNSGAHLHLFSEPNGSTNVHDTITKNPLQYVNYAAPAYEIQLRKVTNYSSNTTEPWIGISYPGTTISPIVVRPIMQNEGANLNRYNTLNHVNRVELLIKKKDENSYKLIEGTTQKSDIRLGGRIGEEMLPENMYTDGSIANPGTPQIGNLTRQGIRPFAYATNNAHPYDDYYFPNLIPRLHSDTNLTAGALSYCP